MVALTVELLFVAHNRLDMTHVAFTELLANTNWDLVNHLTVIDDNSTDGTEEYLREAISLAPDDSWFVPGVFGGPVAVMNRCLDLTESDVLAKIDSDLVVCPGWLDVMLDTLADYPNVDALGMEPGFADPVQPVTVPHYAQEARWIGGVGVFHRRVFARRRPKAHDRFFGLTQHWRKYARCAWISPDLPCFLLDHLGFEPWVSLADEYCERGWSRPWAKYGPEMAPYYEWWLQTADSPKMETAGT